MPPLPPLLPLLPPALPPPLPPPLLLLLPLPPLPLLLPLPCLTDWVALVRAGRLAMRTNLVTERDTHTPCGAPSAPPALVRVGSRCSRCHGSCAWGGMRIPLRRQVLSHSNDIIRLIRPIVAVIMRHDRDLAVNLRRAASSIGSNALEAFGAQAGNSRVRFETARGSLYETEANLLMAEAWGYVTADEIGEALRQIDSLGARIYGLSKKQ